MKKIGLVVVSVLLALMIALPQGALAGAFVLHPRGFGEHSYSSWKGGEGLADNTGTSNEALYFQKFTDTFVFAAGVAVFKGFAGMPTSAITFLEFWFRTDGWCGAGAPRFNVVFRDTTGMTQVLFFGCNSGMTAGGMATAPNGMVFHQRCAGTCASGIVLPAGTIRAIVIVFDEGTTLAGAPLGPGFVFLDDIRVGTHLWRSASDNGDNPRSTANTEESLEELLGIPLSLLFPES